MVKTKLKKDKQWSTKPCIKKETHVDLCLEG
jgi:hypothetical protein